jgi:hypothetical protein
MESTDQGPKKQLKHDKAQMGHAQGSNIIMTTLSHLSKRENFNSLLNQSLDF